MTLYDMRGNIASDWLIGRVSPGKQPQCQEIQANQWKVELPADAWLRQARAINAGQYTII